MKEPIVIYPGCVTFTHKSFFDYCKHIANSYEVDKIRVFVHTWEIDFNKDYLDALKKEFSKHSYITLELITEPYNSPEFKSFLNNIKNNKLHFVPFIKKFVVFYSIARIMERVYSYNPDCLVFKVRSGYRFNCFDNLKERINYEYNDLRFYLKPVYFKNLTQDDVFWTKSMNKDGISEVIFIATSRLLFDTFSKSPKELSDKLKAILNRYQKEFSSLSFEDLILQGGFPFSGPLLLKDLLPDYSLPSIFKYFNQSCYSISPVNPLVWIDDNNKVHVENKRSIPYNNRKDLILEPKKEDWRNLPSNL